MSESQQKVFNILTKVVMWVSLAGAVASSLATYLADAGLEVPAILSSILSIIILISRFVLRTYPGFREIFLVFGLAGSSIAATGVLTPEPAPVEMEMPTGEPGEPVLDVIEVEEGDSTYLDTLGLISSFIAPIGCAHVKPVAIQVGTILGQCLAKAGLAGLGDFVTQWEGGEAIDASVVGWDSLQEFINCAIAKGAYILATTPLTNLPDSVGATMPYSNRVISALVDDPLVMCGDKTGEPSCVIILPR